MADKRSFVSTVQFKGPAGNATTNKRTIVTQVNLHGPINKQTIVTLLQLVAPPLSKKTRISQLQLVGPNSPSEPLYYGSPSGWVPVTAYFGGTTVWGPID